MTTYAVTGYLGRLVVEGLLDAGVPAHDVVAIARTPINRVRAHQQGPRPGRQRGRGS